jgi:hypothetical protein
MKKPDVRMRTNNIGDRIITINGIERIGILPRESDIPSTLVVWNEDGEPLFSMDIDTGRVICR